MTKLSKEEKEMQDLKADLKAANQEAQNYMDEKVSLREDNRLLKVYVRMLEYQISLIRQVLSMTFKM